MFRLLMLHSLMLYVEVVWVDVVWRVLPWWMLHGWMLYGWILRYLYLTVRSMGFADRKPRGLLRLPVAYSLAESLPRVA